MRNKSPCCLLMPDIYPGLAASHPAGRAGAESREDVWHSEAGKEVKGQGHGVAIERQRAARARTLLD